MSNQDRYCLRIDFPHDQYAYIHFNIHESGKKAGAVRYDWDLTIESGKI